MMEKNGAISSSTPKCGNNCNCTKQANSAVTTKQYMAYPTNKQEADIIDTDMLKQAAELVKDAFKPSH
jgi:hypothetical protein